MIIDDKQNCSTEIAKVSQVIEEQERRTDNQFLSSHQILGRQVLAAFHERKGNYRSCYCKRCRVNNDVNN